MPAIVFTERMLDWLVMPYAAPDACWGCGLEADAEKSTEFRHPLFGRKPNLCAYCAELRTLVMR